MMVAVMAMFTGFIANCETKDIEKKKVESEHNLQMERQTKELTTRYNAVIDWKGAFKEDSIAGFYSIQVQEALLNTNGRPVLLLGTVDDVLKRDNQYIVRIFTWLNLLTGIYFELLSTEDQVKRLLKIPTEKIKYGIATHSPFMDEVAIVATIENIRKPVFEVGTNPLGEGEAEITIQSSDIFIGTGKLLDFLYVGDLVSNLNQGGVE
jgi:hypothetical protein